MTEWFIQKYDLMKCQMQCHSDWFIQARFQRGSYLQIAYEMSQYFEGKDEEWERQYPVMFYPDPSQVTFNLKDESYHKPASKTS